MAKRKTEIAFEGDYLKMTLCSADFIHEYVKLAWLVVLLITQPNLFTNNNEHQNLVADRFCFIHPAKSAPISAPKKSFFHSTEAPPTIFCEKPQRHNANFSSM